MQVKMSGENVCRTEMKGMSEDEPEEGEIQDDDECENSLEDVSSEEDMSSTCRKGICRTYFDNNYTVPDITSAEFVSQSSLAHNSRVSKVCDRKTRRFSSSIEENKPRLSVGKYREDINKNGNDSYHVRLNSVVDGCKREDCFSGVRLEYKSSVRPTKETKDEDIAQEKENRQECRKNPKVKRKCKRKHRHSLLHNSDPRQSVSNEDKTDTEVGHLNVSLEEGKKRKESLAKIETKSKNSHCKRKGISPKREKHRSRKKGNKKLLNKRFSNTVVKHGFNDDEHQENSLYKRLKAMMAINLASHKEKLLIEDTAKTYVQNQETGHNIKKKLYNLIPDVQTANENSKISCSPAKSEVSKCTDEDPSIPEEACEVEILPITEKPEPLVITLEDSDNEHISGENLDNKISEDNATKDEMEVVTIETKDTDDDDDDDEDLVQLRLLALQSHRRKEISKPRVEDDEVLQLRLAALKSAYLKKCQARKQRGVSLKSKSFGMEETTLDNTVLKDMEQCMKDNSFDEVSSHQIISINTLQNEPDETTTLVDMDLSHTDDESSIQNDIIVASDTINIPLPKEPESNCNKQSTAYSESLIEVPVDKTVDLKQNGTENNVIQTWDPSGTLYGNSEMTNCQMYNHNMQISTGHTIGYSNSQLSFPTSQCQQQQLYHELYKSNNNPGLPNADLDGVPLDAISNSFDSSVSTANAALFVPSNLSSSGLHNPFLTSRAETLTYNNDTLLPQSETSALNADCNKENLSKETPAFVNSSMSGTGTQELGTIYSAEVIDPHILQNNSTVAPQNGNRNSKDLDLKILQPAFAEESDSNFNPVLPLSSEMIIDAGVQELKENNSNSHQNLNSFEVVKRNNKKDLNMEENASGSENMDMCSMIVLDEIGLCSSPEAKGEAHETVGSKCESLPVGKLETSSGSLDEDEELLRAKVLTTLKKSYNKDKLPASLVTSSFNEYKKINCERNKINSSLIQLSSDFVQPGTSHSSNTVYHKSSVCVNESKPSTSQDSQQVKRPKISQKLNKLGYSRNFSVADKGHISKKTWKKTVKNTKQILTKVNKNPTPLKKLLEHTVYFNDTHSDPKFNISHLKPTVNTVSRVVYGSRLPPSASLQVTVPAKNTDDERCKRTVAESGLNQGTGMQTLQRFVIRLGEDSDSPDEEDKDLQSVQIPKRRCVLRNTSLPVRASLMTSNKSNSACNDGHVECAQIDGSLSDKKQVNTKSKVSVDFEKSVDIFLKQARKSQEARTKSGVKTSAVSKILDGKSNSTSVTPLAVRHLPSSQQEEYRRLKRQIAELEKQRKHQALSKNIASGTKSVSLSSSPGRVAVIDGNNKSPLKIVVTNSNSEGKVISPNSTRKIYKTLKFSDVHMNRRLNETSLETRIVTINDLPISAAVVQTDAATASTESNDQGTLSSVVERTENEGDKDMDTTLHEEPEQKEIAEISQNVDSSAKKEEFATVGKNCALLPSDLQKNNVDVSSDKSDKQPSFFIPPKECAEDRQGKLAEIELQLLSKRYEVLDDLTNMTALLHQVEMEKVTEDECLTELRRLHAELHRAEERHTRQKALLLNMNKSVAETRRRVNKGRSDCIGLSKVCMSLGILVKGKHYKVPSGGAELMKHKVQQVAAQTRRMSKKKDWEEGEEGLLRIPSEVSTQVKPVTEVTSCSAVENPKSSILTSNKICASVPMDVDVSQEDEVCSDSRNTNVSISDTNVSQPKHLNLSNTLDFPLEHSTHSTRTGSDKCVVMESDNCVPVPNEDHKKRECDDFVEIAECNSTMNDVKQISTGKSEELYFEEEKEKMVMGKDISARQTLSRHITDYRSPLEHFNSKRDEIKTGNDWCGPLDPHAILCPYELMGSCQDEECSYQHQTKPNPT